MSKETNTLVYRDFDFRFIAHPITGKLNIKKNADAVKQAVKLLIMTNLYERPYRPKFGGNIRAHLFENYTPITQENIRYTIQTALENFEPRIELLDIRFGGDPDKNEMAITIFFRPLNSTEIVSVNVNLERIR